MAKLVYQEPEDFLVRVSICSLSSFLTPSPLLINPNIALIENILANCTDSNFIVFPEYTYSEELMELYQTFSNQHNTIIIAGSGLEAIGDKFYAFCPVFIPNSEIIKIYKKHLTPTERVLSYGKIIDYKNDTQREINVTFDDRDITFSVYICYDFLIENKDRRTDLVFVPQYEASPEQFINEGDRVSKGFGNFVIGCNNCNENQRSLGFAILNSGLINNLFQLGIRNENYNDMANKPLNYHHTIIYDINDQRVITLDLNVGKPYSLPYTYSLNGNLPVIVPYNNIQL